MSTLEFSAARATFERLGARPDRAQLDRILAATGAGSATHGLTRREIEILCLIARRGEPCDRKRAAPQERMVHRHVSNIFVNLDVGSRTAAAGYGIRHRTVGMGTL